MASHEAREAHRHMEVPPGRVFATDSLDNTRSILGRDEPVISPCHLNASYGITRQTGRKYYRPSWLDSLSDAGFRGMTGWTVNPQVPGSSPDRRANSIRSLPNILPSRFGAAVYKNVAEKSVVRRQPLLFSRLFKALHSSLICCAGGKSGAQNPVR